FFFSSRRRHTRSLRDWSSDVCSSDLDLRFDGVTFGWGRSPGELLPCSRGNSNRSHQSSKLRITETRKNEQGNIPNGKDTDDCLRSEERRVGKEWRYRW